MLATIGTLDGLVLVTTLLLAIGIGILGRGRQRTLDAYFLGDRNLPWWAILGSIVATETSTATVLSVPGQGIGDTGLRFLQLALGLILGRCVVIYLLLPLYFRGQLSTAYQVLRERFGLATSRVASAVFLISRNLGDGLRLYLAGLVLATILDWSLSWACIVVGSVTILYTWWGGLRSIVWNDCVQWCIYMLGAFVILAVLVQELPDGLTTLWEHGQQTGKWQWLEWDWRHPYSFWGGVFGGLVLSMATHGVDHMMVQRYLSARSQRDATWAIFLSGFVVAFQFALFVVIGIALAAYYQSVPTAPSPPDRLDQVLVHFVVHVFPAGTGFVGLLLAAIFAASMSTLSSSLNASASAVIHDFWLAATPAGTADHATEQSPQSNAPAGRQLVQVSRGLTLVFGVLQIAIAIQAQYLTASVIDNALKIAGLSGGLLLGVFLLGISRQQRDPQIPDQVAGDQVAAITALTITASILLGVETIGPVYGFTVGVPWLALVAVALTLTVGHLTYWIVQRSHKSKK